MTSDQDLKIKPDHRPHTRNKDEPFYALHLAMKTSNSSSTVQSTGTGYQPLIANRTKPHLPWQFADHQCFFPGTHPTEPVTRSSSTQPPPPTERHAETKTKWPPPLFKNQKLPIKYSMDSVSLTITVQKRKSIFLRRKPVSSSLEE